MPTQKLTVAIIHAAIEGFESQKRRIDSQIDELRQLLNGGSVEAGSGSGTPASKRRISAAGRRRMAAAQKARWAKVRADAEPGSSLAELKPGTQKRKLSAAGRKAISEATKKRWALKRAEASKGATKNTTTRNLQRKARRPPEKSAASSS